MNHVRFSASHLFQGSENRYTMLRRHLPRTILVQIRDPHDFNVAQGLQGTDMIGTDITCPNQPNPDLFVMRRFHAASARRFQVLRPPGTPNSSSPPPACVAPVPILNLRLGRARRHARTDLDPPRCERIPRTAESPEWRQIGRAHV